MIGHILFVLRLVILCELKVVYWDYSLEPHGPLFDDCKIIFWIDDMYIYKIQKAQTGVRVCVCVCVCVCI